MSVENSVKLPFFGLYMWLDKNSAEAVCSGFLDLYAGRRMQYKCLLMLFACFVQGLRESMCKQSSRFVKICFLLCEINIHRFLLLVIVSNFSLVSEDY